MKDAVSLSKINEIAKFIERIDTIKGETFIFHSAEPGIVIARGDEYCNYQEGVVNSITIIISNDNRIMVTSNYHILHFESVEDLLKQELDNIIDNLKK